MKVFTFLLLAALSCAMPCLADEAGNIETARAMVEAINARELGRLDRLIAPDVVRHSAATAGVSITSLEDFKAFLQTDFAAVPDSVIDIEIILGNDRYVAMRAIYSGTQTGPMGPFPASGRRIELPFIGILRFDGGRIAEMWVEWDNVYMLNQLGHLAPPAEE